MSARSLTAAATFLIADSLSDRERKGKAFGRSVEHKAYIYLVSKQTAKTNLRDLEITEYSAENKYSANVYL